MALVDTARAIRVVTEAISERLGARTGLAPSVGRPEPEASAGGKRLNLFLYEMHFDSSLKNVALDDGQMPPLWLVLKYLMTAFDDEKSSDSAQAYEYLGQGIQALQEMSLFQPLDLPADSLKALTPNPEDLKITLDETPSDLLSKVMQGGDEKYRLSVGFEVRPVMIAAAEATSYSLLVGVDYTTTPVTPVGAQAIRIPVIPSLGPAISAISPESFNLGDTVTVHGTDLHLSNLSVNLGPVVLPVTMQQPEQLQFVVREDIAMADVISAGSLPISLSQLLPNGRTRSSNLLAGNLLPQLSAAVVVGGSLQHVAVAPPPAGWSFAQIDITGKLLGNGDTDDSYLGLFKDGLSVKLIDDSTDTSPAAARQTQRRFTMQKPDAVPPGQYLVLCRVNGQQARQSVVIDLT